MAVKKDMKIIRSVKKMSKIEAILELAIPKPKLISKGNMSKPFDYKIPDNKWKRVKTGIAKGIGVEYEDVPDKDKEIENLKSVKKTYQRLAKKRRLYANHLAVVLRKKNKEILDLKNELDSLEMVLEEKEKAYEDVIKGLKKQLDIEVEIEKGILETIEELKAKIDDLDMEARAKGMDNAKLKAEVDTLNKYIELNY